MLDLEKLVAPLTADEFRTQYWPRRPVHVAGDAHRLEGALDIPELGSGEDVLASFGDRVSILRPDGFHADVADGSAALPFYGAEFTCYLRRAERFFPTLADSVARIAADLGQPTSSFTCEIFCSTGGESDTSAPRALSGLAMHSDYDVNLALLLRGEKTWRWAPNHHVRNQTSVLVGGAARQVDESQLRYADSLPLPADFPEDAETVTVHGGGLVFMPRGWWHATSARGECLQLNFTMKGPTWADVVAGALREHLLDDPSWRGYAYGVLGSEEARAAAREELVELLDGLADEGTSQDTEKLAELTLAHVRSLTEAAG